MAPKNDTPVLLLTFLITAALIGGGFWWFTRQSGVDLRQLQPESNSDSGTPSSPSHSSNTSSQGTVAGFANVPNVPSGLFNYGGSTSWAPIRSQVDAAIQKARSEFRLRYVEPIGSPPGSGTGIRMLIRDELALAQSSRPISDQEHQQATQRGFKLKQIPVAIDGLAVAVNPSLNISGLTIDQLKGIYTGQITNWNQVGGSDLAIQPFTRPVDAGGTIELFVEEILKGEAFGSNVQTVSTTTEALRKLANNPGGIYFASAPEVVPQCRAKPLPLGRRSGEFVAPYRDSLVPPSECPGRRNQLNAEALQTGQYPLTRNLYVVVKQNGRIEEQTGEAYANLLLTKQGQDLIAKAGFVKIR